MLDKSLVLLGALEPGPLSLAALVEQTGLTRATCHRLATALEAHGLLRRTPDGRFALGYRLLGLGRRAEAQMPLVQLAAPHVRGLRDRTGESAQLYVVDGDERVCVVSAESAHGLRTIVSVGARLTMKQGSAAHVLRGVPVPSSGWLASLEERELGVASVSAPIVGANGMMVAALSVSGPVDRISRRPGDRYGEAVAVAAAAVSAEL